MAIGGIATIACGMLAATMPVLVGHPMPAVTFPQAHSVLKADPAELYGRLPNGMTYVIEHNATPPGTATVMMRVRAGSMMEADDQKGLAHFVEHMAFEGTAHIPHGALKPMLEREGFAFGADANAFTTDQATTYILSAPRDDNKTLASALFILREIAGNMTIDPANVDTERGVVLSEERLDDSPGQRGYDALGRFLFAGLRRADHAEPIGSADIVRGASAADLSRFYRTWYRPELTTLVVVGDFDAKAMEKEIRAKFSGWKATTPPPDEPDWGTYQAKGPRVFGYTGKGIDRALGAMWVQPPETRPDGPERITNQLQDSLLMTLLGRRYHQISQPDTASLAIQLTYNRVDYKTARANVLNIVAKPGGTKDAFDHDWAILRTFIDQGVTPDEVALAQSVAATQRRDLAKSYATRGDSEIANGILRAIDTDFVDQDLVDRLQTMEVAAAGLTQDRLNARLKAVFGGDGPVFMDWGAESLADFPPDAVLAEYARVSASKDKAYAGQVQKPWPYGDFGPPVAPATHAVDPDFGFGHYVFPNGVVLNVKSDRFSAGQVLVQVAYGGGLARFDPQTPRPVPLATGDLFSKGGLGKLDVDGLQRSVAGKSASVVYSLELSRTTLNGTTTGDDLPLQMQLLMAYATDPGLRENDYTTAQAYVPEYLRTLQADPGAVLGYELHKVIHPGDWRFNAALIARAPSIKWADVASIYRDSLKDAPMTITIAGDVDEAKAVAAVASTFATLPPRPATAPAAPGAEAMHFPPAEHEFVFTHNGRADQNISVALWPTTDYYSDTKRANGMTVLAGILQNRLYDQLRESEGADYAPRADSDSYNAPAGYGYLQVTATVKASDDGVFRDTLNRIVADLKAHPPTADEIARVTTPLLRNDETAKQTNAYWFSTLDTVATYPDGRRATLGFAADIRAVDGPMLMALAQTWLKDDTEIHVTVKPAPADPSSGLVNRPDVADMRVYGAPAGRTLIPAPSLPGGSAVRVEVPAPAAASHPWDVGVSVLTRADIHKGDPVTVAFWARATAPGGKITARLQSDEPPYPGIAQRDIRLDTTWKWYVLEGVADQDLLAGRAGLSLSLNTQAQVIDIGPAYIFTGPLDTTWLKERMKAIPIGRAVDAMIDTPSGDKLAATLRWPAGPGPFPAVTTITGSGAWGRNPEDSLSTALLDHGIAVLQYDKRGVGQSTGTLQTASQDDLTQDAAAMAAWLRTQPGIDASHTSTLGASQGGLISLLVAARDPKVAFVVSMAGPAVPMGELGVEQQEMALADAGLDPAKVATGAKILRAYIAAVQSASGGDDAAAQVKAALAPYVGPDFPEASLDALAEATRHRDAKAADLYDPKVDLARLHVPVLGLFGSKDHLVPAEPNAEALRHDLAGDGDVTVTILPGFNHLFQHATTGSVAEMGQLTEPSGSDPALQKEIVDWIEAHTR